MYKQLALIVLLCAGLSAAANVLEFGQRQAGDEEIFRITTASEVSDEVALHNTYYRWEQEGASQFTGAEIHVAKWTAANVYFGQDNEYFEYSIEDYYTTQIEAELIVYGFP